MPNNVVHTDKDEEKWEKAKAIAENEDKGDNHAYIMSLYKKMDPSHDFEKESQLSPFQRGYTQFMNMAMGNQ